MAPLMVFLMYGDNRLSTNVLKHQGIVATPFRWWERSAGFTYDSGMLLGGAAGLVLGSRSLSVRSLSSLSQQWARLGAASAGGTLGVMSASWLHLYHHGTAALEDLTHRKSQIEASRHQIFAKLNRDTTFTDTLGVSARVYLFLQARMAFAPLLEDKASSSPIEWLDPASFEFMIRSSERGFQPLSDWEFGDATTTPEEVLDLMFREASSLAAHIRPRAHALHKLKVTSKVETPGYRFIALELSSLTVMQTDLVHKILALRAQQDPEVTFFQVLQSLEPDAPFVKHHIPMSSINYLKETLEDQARHEIDQTLVNRGFQPGMFEQATRNLIAGLEKAPP